MGFGVIMGGGTGRTAPLLIVGMFGAGGPLLDWLLSVSKDTVWRRYVRVAAVCSLFAAHFAPKRTG